jgi:transaldolase
MHKFNKFKIQIYSDGAKISDFYDLRLKKYIKGFTTNPSLMKQAGVNNYKRFSMKVLNLVKKKPVSLEIFADNTNEIEEQAKQITSWGKNVYVKIPIINTKNQLNSKLIGHLNSQKIKINVTAVFTISQTRSLLKRLNKSSKTPLILSVFAGRIADTGVDPVKEIKTHIKICKKFKFIKILWASVREPFNLIQAEESKCHIITIPPSILKKFSSLNKNLNNFSIETVKSFYEDAKKLNYNLD